MFPALVHWHLQLLAVHPTARRRGIGSTLVRMGIDRARRDGCIAGLEASPLGLNMYKSQGFEVVGTYAMERELEEDGRPLLSLVLAWRDPDVVRSDVVNGSGVEAMGGR
ncbi:hypothetical protein Dda_9455 [Drechslerella dactyloides]|uniref:N-acetyltransferase domain-containing protein n=1 Tax=Drechslerella dactyloides TaxID=74499 RepID=A0AAD6IPC6_DREDA|nr:hypothetical protein Dda_9455 [Drechslerella dactyloides]